MSKDQCRQEKNTNRNRSWEKDRIDPELRGIALDIPFNTAMIRMSAAVQPLMGKAAKLPAGVRQQKYVVGGYRGMQVPVEVFEPEGADGSLPCLLLIHGGGFGYGASPGHRRLACIYAKEANCRVVFPEYHRTPEYRFPAAYEDIMAVYGWLCRHVDRLGIDSGHIAVAGDSAGGALAANLCNTAVGRGLPLPCLQMLIYPVTDADMRSASMQSYPDTPLWNTVNNRRMWELYLPDRKPETLALASPLHNVLPQEIPDTYIEVAELDCLHDDGVLYAEKLRNHLGKECGEAGRQQEIDRCGEAGGQQTRVELYETKGTIHGYDTALQSAVTRGCVKRRLAVLRRAFRG